MIQPVPPSPMPATVSLALPGEAAAAASGEMAETLDFSALLALESEAGEATDPAAAAMALPVLPEQVLAAAAAMGGKILPPALPEEAPEPPQHESTAPGTEQAAEPVLTAALAAAPPPPAMPPLDMAAAEQPAEKAPAPRQMPAVAAQAALAALMQRPGPARPDQIRADTVPQASQIPAETLALDLPTAAVRKAVSAPGPAEEVQLDLAQITPALPRGEQRLAGEAALSAVSAIEAAAVNPQSSLSNNAPQSALSSLQPSPAAIRPHDFSALIDRLTAAREAMAPANVAITVAHQDFGPVRLRFRSEDAGLSVAMTSADPGFARAAAAAPLPVLPTASAEQSPQRGDGGQAQTGSSGSSGSSGRGATPERREGQPQPGHHRAHDRAPDQPGNRRGIFA